MTALTCEMLGKACRLFLSLAYPGGTATIPQKRAAYNAIPPDCNLDDYLPPGGQAAKGIGQALRFEDGGLRGYTFRLGSAHFPHLKLQVTFHNDGTALVFAVDTHDTWPVTGPLPDNHPDHAAWMELRLRNQRIKEVIEQAWDQAGLWTFNRLLREELKDQE